MITSDQDTNGLTDPKAQQIVALSRLGGQVIIGLLAGALIYVFGQAVTESMRAHSSRSADLHETLRICIQKQVTTARDRR